MTSRPISKGDRVAYAVQFLRSISCCTGDLPAARGVVTEVRQLGNRQLVTIDWGPGADLPQRVIADNLARVGPNSRFCACD